MSLANTFRIIVKLVTALVIIPISGEFAVKLVEQYGLYEDPTGRMMATVAAIASITNWPAFYPTLFFLVGVTAGGWLDGLARRFDARRRYSTDYYSLGKEAVWMAERIRSHLDNGGFDNSDSFDRIFPDLNSLRIKLRKAGFELPKGDNSTRVTEEWVRQTSRYLGLLGPLLRDGHIIEAAEMSLYFTGSDPSRRVGV